MNKHLDEYLCKKYPKIFKDRNAPMTETCMCWGFPGDGWFFLIDNLCNSIQNHIDNPPYVYKKSLKVYTSRVWNWIAIHLHLSYKFIWYGDVYEKGVVPQVVATQVKEKFGGLRFYYNGGDEHIQGMVDLAESFSYSICERCGTMNELVTQNNKGWMKTTCFNCVETHLKENHKENQQTELIELWNKVRINKQNDRSTEAF